MQELLETNKKAITNLETQSRSLLKNGISNENRNQ